MPPMLGTARFTALALGAARLKQHAELLPCLQVYMAIVGGGPMYTLVLGANFHRAYYTVYEYDAYTDTARVSSCSTIVSLATS